MQLSSLVRHLIGKAGNTGWVGPEISSGHGAGIRGVSAAKGSVGQAFKPDMGKNLTEIFLKSMTSASARAEKLALGAGGSRVLLRASRCGKQVEILWAQSVDSAAAGR